MNLFNFLLLIKDAGKSKLILIRRMYFEMGKGNRTVTGDFESPLKESMVYDLIYP